MERFPFAQVFRLIDTPVDAAATVILSIALIVGALIAGGRSPRRATRVMHALRVILDSFAGLLVLFCLLNVASAVARLYGHDAAGTYVQYGARAQAVMALLISRFLWHSPLMALVSIFVFVPSTRSHPDIARAAILFMVAISLPMVIIIYWGLTWWPGADFHFHVRVRTLAPLLACVLAAAVWFGLKVGLALRHQRDARAWTIGGLAVFHLACVCTYTILLCVVLARLAPELNQPRFKEIGKDHRGESAISGQQPRP